VSWKKSTQDQVARFDALAKVAGAERGVLFGCPTWKVNGNRYATLFGDQVVLRLSDEDTAALKAKGAKAFEPMKGKKSSKSLVVPGAMAKNPRVLKQWIAKAVAHAKA
jgi:hypothetical protein